MTEYIKNEKRKVSIYEEEEAVTNYIRNGYVKKFLIFSFVNSEGKTKKNYGQG